MRYITIFNPREKMSETDCCYEREEWSQKCKDELKHRGCRGIARFETVGEVPHKVFVMMQADDPHALDMLCCHFGKTWQAEAYRVQPIPDVLGDDHAVVAG